MYVSTPNNITLQQRFNLFNQYNIDFMNYEGVVNTYSSYSTYNGGDTWDSTAVVYPGRIVVYNGNLYEALYNPGQGYNLNKVPTEHIGTWWAFIGPSPIPIEGSSPWNINSVITYGWKYYKSLIDNNTSLPPQVFPDKWQDIGYLNALQQFDETNSTYTIGQKYLEYTLYDNYSINEKLKGLGFARLENIDTIVISANIATNSKYLATDLIPLDPIYDVKEWTSTDPVEYYNFVYFSFSGIVNNVWRAYKNAQKKTTATIKLYNKLALEAFQIITGDYIDAMPKGLAVYGSNNNGITWTTIYNNSNLNLVTDPMTKSQTYYINNKSPYLWYKLEFLDSKVTTAPYIDVNEVILLYSKNTQLNNSWKQYNLNNTTNNITVSYPPNIVNNYTSINNTNIVNFSVTSDIVNGETIDNSFDSNTATKWYTSAGYFNESPYWAQATIQLQQPICVQQLQFVTANDEPSRDPSNYIIFGSNTGQEWVLLNSRDIELPYERYAASPIYPINNLNSYLYYHIVFSKQKDKSITYSGEANYQVSEIKLLYNPSDISGALLREYNAINNNNFSFIVNSDEATVFVDSQSNNIFYTQSDPKLVHTWKQAQIPENTSIVINSLSYENNIFFVTATNQITNTGEIWTSLDGIAWKKINISTASAIGTLSNIIYCGNNINRYVTIDSNKKILTSINGTTWLWENSATVLQNSGYQATNYNIKKIAWSTKAKTLAIVGSGYVTWQTTYPLNGPTVIVTKNLLNWSVYNDSSRPAIEQDLMEIISVSSISDTPNFKIGGYNNVYELMYYDDTDTWNLWRLSSFIFNAQNITSGSIKSITYDPTKNLWYLGGTGTTSYVSNLSPIVYILNNSLASTASLVDLNSTQSSTHTVYFNTKYGHLMASIGNSIYLNSPIYYEKRNLKIKNTNKFNKTATFIPENIIAEYSNIGYKVQVYGGYNMKIGTCILTTNNYYLGEVQRGVGIDLIDYSIKNTDEFGNMSIVERTYGDKITLNTIIPIEDINNIKSILNKLRSTVCIWNISKDPKYDKLNFYGFYRNYSISVENPKLATLTLELESLVYE